MTMLRWSARPIFVLAVLGATIPAPRAQDASAVLADMRKALGGDAVLDGIRAVSASGSIAEAHGSFRSSYPLQLHVLLPDHYMTVRSQRGMGGPMDVDITYYRGFSRGVLIRRTDSTIPFPPDPGPQTPDAIAERERDMLQRNRQEFARLALVLFGRAFDAYPLQLAYAGRETVEAKVVDVIEATGPGGFATRLYVDAVSHLPAIVAWQAPRETIVTTSSTAIVRGNQVVSQSPPGPLPSIDPRAAPLVMRRLVISEFKLQDGVNWPRRLQVLIGKDVVEDMRLGKISLNPRIDARKFDVGR